MQDILEKKNTLIKDLQYELMRISKAHDDLIDTYEDKLQQYGVSKEELGYIPLRIVPECHAGLGRGPAGLVTKNK